MPPPRYPLARVVAVLAFVLLACGPSLHAAKGAKADGREMIDGGSADAKGNKRRDNAGTKAGSAAQGDAEARMLAKIRERLDVADDDEWAVIAERIAKVETLRRALAAGASNTRLSSATADKGKRGARTGTSATPEFDSLRAALADQYPDAEIKSRLIRAHEVYAEKENQLRKAQAELRSVLSVRQEAMAVMAGMLPP